MLQENMVKEKEEGLCVASIAQWLEHWSRKPGVVSSILTGGSHFRCNCLNIYTSFLNPGILRKTRTR